MAALLSPDRTKESAASFSFFWGLGPRLSWLACLGFARLASSRHHGFIKSDERFVFWKPMVSRSVTLQRKIRDCSQSPFSFVPINLQRCLPHELKGSILRLSHLHFACCYWISSRTLFSVYRRMFRSTWDAEENHNRCSDYSFQQL